MTVILPPLPYAANALEPHISAATMEVHHGKHHKTYVDKLNAAIKDTLYAELDLNEIVISASDAKDTGIFNNAAQAWNHGFYWHCLTDNAGAEMTAELKAAIIKAFGSQAELIKSLQEAGEKHFGSGWAWLVLDDGELKVLSMHDAETPIAVSKKMIPLLTLDVWEHAYYLDRKNERPKYLAAALSNLINWDFVSANFASAKAWQYPAS
jgi:superoxide dismutase, Fe-Mn family